MSERINSEKITADLLRPIRLNKGFMVWMGVLSISLLVCLFAYFLQLRDGMIVTGLGDYVSWGMYISNFVFFVASSLIGMLISGVLSLLKQKWAAPLARIAEIIALAFAAVAGLVIVMDMGRPDRLLNVFIHGRIQSPILWDVTVITSYMIVSALFLYIPLIPDLKICAQKLTNIPPFARKIYEFLSLNWSDTPVQRELIRKSTRTIAILIIPIALAIHTVTSWLFANTSRAGWDSTIFGPYFVAGAFVAGTAAVIIAMFIFRKVYHLEEYITEFHFDKIGQLLVLVSLLYLYFNVNEYMVPAYKMKRADAFHIHELFVGSHALLFWITQLGGLIIPIILLILKPFRKPIPMLVISTMVLIGSWLKRYIIVIPTMEHPYLPVQNVPLKFSVYTPTLIEILVTIAPMIMVLLIITVLAKVIPIIPIHETIEHQQEIASKKK
ncbi:MAG: polysulfide reductase [Porphyromonadaceae bacterium CG2_30_38_12]|nr:MAG: polysulfide reductase [Porphyromonadaceae bacterium CG2_30_38_12]